MGIPIVDPLASYSFATQHPYLAALIIAAMLAVTAAFWLFFRKRRKRAAVAVVWLTCCTLAGVWIGMMWAISSPQPSPLAQHFEAAQAAAQKLQNQPEK